MLIVSVISVIWMLLSSVISFHIQHSSNNTERPVCGHGIYPRILMDWNHSGPFICPSYFLLLGYLKTMLITSLLLKFINIIWRLKRIEILFPFCTLDVNKVRIKLLTKAKFGYLSSNQALFFFLPLRWSKANKLKTIGIAKQMQIKGIFNEEQNLKTFKMN